MTTTAKYPSAALADFGADVADIKTAVLSGAHNSSVATITLTATVPTEWPTQGWVTIDGEIVLYTGKSGSTLTGCSRGQQTAYGAGIAAAHSDQAIVAPYLTAQQFNQVVAEIIAHQTALAAKITVATEQATTSGTSIDFTSIPTGTKRITLEFVGVSTNGTSVLLLQIGKSGGVETTGYLGSGSTFDVAVGSSNFTTGFGLGNANAAAAVWHGTITLTLERTSTFTWTAAGVIGRSDAAQCGLTSGSKALAAELDRIRLTTVNGTDAFDAGKVNILYE